MNNLDIASIFKLYGQLLELYGENPFKTRAYSNVAYTLKKMDKPVADIPIEEVAEMKGFGKAVVSKLDMLLKTGEIPQLKELMDKTPDGVMEMMGIKGLGPKKIGVLWRELGVESVGELLYASNENRLVELKGFGEKTQASIIKSLEYFNASRGKFHYAQAEAEANEIAGYLQEEFPDNRLSLTGAMRRCLDIVEEIDFLIADADLKELNASLSKLKLEGKIDKQTWRGHSHNGIKLNFLVCPESEFEYHLFESTATESHLEQLGKYSKDKSLSEEDIYKSVKLPFIEPELREGRGEVDWAKKKALPELVKMEDLKGLLHNHSTYSDGRNTLREMAEYMVELGYEYFGICDHSKTAVYAGGLREEDVMRQHKEIEELNLELAPFKILKGIESDILNDGSLDYSDEVLATFDMVVASVHSNLKMDEKKAITILGHPTGRLLLSREGYPVDHKKMIDACAANGVIMEMNANPYRLDMDWRWIHYALEKNVMISINPDAHNRQGLHDTRYGLLADTRYGLLAARKGGLSKEMTFNAKSLEEMTKYLDKK